MAKRFKGKAALEKKNEALENLSIEYVEIGTVKPNNYNPNRQSDHEFTLLKKSMSEDGFTQPIIVAADLTIVDGEHRWRAAAELGYDNVPVVRVPMEAAQAKIATLRHNRARGSEDIEMATEVLRDLEKLGALDWAQDSLELSDEELNRLLDDIPAPEALAGEEFSQAWNPSTTTEENSDIAEASLDATPAAIQQRREVEQALQTAKTEEEREQIRADRNIYRLSLTFTNEEATVVRSALGDSPAQTILNWCHEKAPATIPA